MIVSCPVGKCTEFLTRHETREMHEYHANTIVICNNTRAGRGWVIAKTQRFKLITMLAGAMQQVKIRGNL